MWGSTDEKALFWRLSHHSLRVLVEFRTCKRSTWASEKFLQRFGGFLGPLFQYPMPGVFEDNDGDVDRDYFGLLAQRFSQRLVASDGQNRHGQFGLSELREIFGGLEK